MISSEFVIFSNLLIAIVLYSINLSMYSLRNESRQEGQGHARAIVIRVLVLFMFLVSVSDKCLGENMKEDPAHLKCLHSTMSRPQSGQDTVCPASHVKAGSVEVIDKYDTSARRMGLQECPPLKSQDEAMTCIDEDMNVDITDETMFDAQKFTETFDSFTESSSKVVSVAEFGAKGDGTTDDTEVRLIITPTRRAYECVILIRMKYVIEKFVCETTSY